MLLDFAPRGLGMAIAPRLIVSNPQAQGLVVKAFANSDAPRWPVLPRRSTTGPGRSPRTSWRW